MKADFAADAVDLIHADRDHDHLGYLRVQRRINHMGREDVVIGQLVGIIRRLSDFAFDCDFEDADSFLDSWIRDISDETQ